MIISVITNNVILMWAANQLNFALSSAFCLTHTNKKPLLRQHGNTSLFVQLVWKWIVWYNSLMSLMELNLLTDPSQAIFWTEINQQAAGLNPMLMYLAFAFILLALVLNAVYFQCILSCLMHTVRHQVQ